ncbi:MAG: HAD-IB family phosphatase, partial [Burkholderiales bacterium]|nr:HAD-IB family phosphatase [Burkholderiales bacterium]
MLMNIIIDFDSTFVKVEALDELATISLANHPDADRIITTIKNITNLGMEGKISISESLNERIKLLQANIKHIDSLVAHLKQQITSSFQRNNEFIKNYAQNIYIISSGFKEYIIPIVSEYGIDDSHVYANTLIYDDVGNIIGMDKTNILCQELGKVKCVANLALSSEVHVIGDGYTDYEITKHGVATKFYAFIENVKRDSVINVAECIIPNFDEFLFQNKLPMALSYPKNRIKILLLENVHPVAIKLLCDEGYAVEAHKGAMNEDELCEKIKGVSILGIRSKTNVTKKVLEHADRLMAIGAFCIGTNQIDLEYATHHGVCVFNAPYSNTRSVVELAIGEIIMLMRNAVAKNTQMHQGIWDKSANNCFEIRGKTLGIIGYGNIGSQLSVLAENLGMKVCYYDLVERLPLSNVKKC